MIIRANQDISVNKTFFMYIFFLWMNLCSLLLFLHLCDSESFKTVLNLQWKWIANMVNGHILHAKPEHFCDEIISILNYWQFCWRVAFFVYQFLWIVTYACWQFFHCLQHKLYQPIKGPKPNFAEEMLNIFHWTFGLPTALG